MEMKVNISAEDINKKITEAVAKSAIGKKLTKQIEKAVASLSVSYDNPFEHIIKAEIRNIMQEIISKDYKETIEKFVKEKVTKDFTDKILDTMWRKLNDNY